MKLVVSMWFDHLQTVLDDRKRGSPKAKDKVTDRMLMWYSCLEPYMDFTKQIKKWIEFEQCESWFHFVCWSYY